MNSAPTFSILVPTYNQATYLPLSLGSLLAQTDPDWEAVIVDDGSTDATPEVCRAHAASDPRLRVFRQANGGTAAALNRALAEARGRWICWLSSDDLFEPFKLALHRWQMEEEPDTRFFHTHFLSLEDETGNITEPDLWRPLPTRELQVARFFSGNYVNGITVCVRREDMLACAPFRADLRHGQDFDFWLRLSQRTPSSFSPRRTATLRWHAGQSTNSFPVAGLYDSAWACVEFLNAHPYAELFPLLDLDDPEQALMAAGETLDILASTGSFVYQCGYIPAFMERFAQWLHARPETAARRACRDLLRRATQREGFGALPRPVRAAFATALDAQKEHGYRPWDMPAFIRQVIAAADTDPRKRENLTRYLEWKGLAAR